MYKKHTLNNGIRVISKKISHVRSVSIGFWINAGSSSETIVNNGTSHFIEHMLFKGTYKRSAKEIASTIDEIGGQLNAFTSKECTCYYTKVLDSHINIGIDVLTDMLLNSKFDVREIEKEKSVICEEINMYEDSPEDVVYDLISKTIFREHSLGLPILGTHNTISNLNREEVIKYMKNNYTSENIVISVAGSFNEDVLIEYLNEKIGNHLFIKNKKPTLDTPSFYSDFSFRHKDIEQTHICIGFKGLPYSEKDMFPLLIINNILGGSMSSRLFQTIREDHGLAYSIYSHPSFYKDVGLSTIYISLNPSQMDMAFKLINDELLSFMKKSITKEEFYKSKEQLKGSYILGLESTSSIMNMLGKSELFGQKIRTPDEVISRINNITLEDADNIIKKILKSDNISMAVVGKTKESIIKSKYELIKEKLIKN